MIDLLLVPRRFEPRARYEMLIVFLSTRPRASASRPHRPSFLAT